MSDALSAHEASVRREQDAGKRSAKRRQVGLVSPGMMIGFGPGSTVGFSLYCLTARLAGGELAGVAGIPASEKTGAEGRRRQPGIPLTSLVDRLERHDHA